MKKEKKKKRMRTRSQSRKLLTQTTSAVIKERNEKSILTNAETESTSSSSHTEDIDKYDTKRVECVVEYVDDAFEDLRQSENSIQKRLRSFEASGQSNQCCEDDNINENMRFILVDWLVSVSLKLKLRSDTLYLAIGLLNRYLSIGKGYDYDPNTDALEKNTLSIEPILLLGDDKKSSTNTNQTHLVTRKTLQGIGVASHILACQLEEVYPPELRDFVYITDKSVSMDELKLYVWKIFHALDFELFTPHPLSFLRRFYKASSLLQKSEDTEMFYCTAKYICECTLLNYRQIQLVYKPSEIAASVVLLTQLIHFPTKTKTKCWTGTLCKYTAYTFSDIVEPMLVIWLWMRCLCVEKRKKSLKGDGVHCKYATKSFHRVSKTICLPSIEYMTTLLKTQIIIRSKNDIVKLFLDWALGEPRDKASVDQFASTFFSRRVSFLT